MLRKTVYGCAIFASSLLLFLIQPIMAKAVLPWFGGSAGVWTTAMLFFQAALLLGYLYAHWTSSHLSPRVQIAVHVTLLAGSLFLLPIVPLTTWKSAGAPALQILAVMARSIGLPFLLLSANGPLVQTWFARTKTALPYRLFAVSNAASLAALLLYPALLEPWIGTHSQLFLWSCCYGCFALLAGAAGFLSASGASLESAKEPSPAWRDKALWIGLAACASALWLAVANTLSQNVAPIPFLWVLPLGIYLLSFTLCFGGDGFYRPRLYRWALPASWVPMVYCIARSSSVGLKTAIAAFSVALFVCCMFCHGELARRKPHPSQLTAFYLMLSLGGALGGLFVGVIAPGVFNRYLELPVALMACILLFLGILLRFPRARIVRFAVLAIAALVVAQRFGDSNIRVVARSRNFYGALQISETGTGESAQRILTNGSIYHGAQFLSADRSRQATTYYGPQSGAAAALAQAGPGPRRIGLIGLGAGTLAAYGREGDYFRFYEINPAVIQVAWEQFRFLKESRGKVEVVTGDGRLALESEPPQQFDVLILDAFSGDSIPMHLLTREAFSLYFSHLKPGGILAAHISNRYLDLGPPLAALAKDRGAALRVLQNAPNLSQGVQPSVWALLAASDEQLPQSGDRLFPRVAKRVWTDEYSNLFETVR